MAKRDKRPARRVEPNPQRHPASPPLEDPNRQTPIWSFAKFDADGPWNCPRVAGQSLDLIVRKLGEFESMTWAEMQQGHRPKAKEIDVAKLCAEAQRRLVEIFQDDVASLWELHLSGQPRLWGIRDRATFQLLWIDLDHEVYPSPKRHT